MDSEFMHLNAIELKIVREIERIEVVDCHEHLPSEAVRVASPVSALTLFSHYCAADLVTAGMPRDQVEMALRSDRPFDERWAAFKSYYPFIRNTAYTRAAHIAMRKFYGESELNDGNVERVNEAIRAANKPGLYRRVLSEACNIRTALTQELLPDDPSDPLLTKVTWIPGKFSSRSVITDRYGPYADGPIRTLADLGQAARRFADQAAKSGAVGVKFFVMPFQTVSTERADEVFRELMADDIIRISEMNPLTEYVLDAITKRCGENGLVVCLHTGYWGDFRTLNPSNAYPLITRHPNVRFDLYHVGYPYTREAIMLGKCQPNVWLNMCWTYAISQKFACDALEEILEMVPMNKILGFGGDYRVVEKVYGHLVMARETIARVLAKKIADGYLSYERAIDAALMILQTNPERLYSLQ